MHAQTIEASQWWARPREQASQSWIANYQQSLTVRHRTAILEIVRSLGIQTLFEAGCHCGPNLMRLTAEIPTLHTWGCDVNADAVTAGRQWAAQRGVADRVRLGVGTFPTDATALPTGSYDAVLSCYSFAYLSPADLDAALYEAGRLATRAIMLAEPMPLDGARASALANLSGYTEWAHDYQGAMRWVGTLRGMTTQIVRIEPPVDRLNAILVGAR